MDTTLDPKQTDPHHVLAARADEQLAHAHEEIKRADEQIVRTNEQLSRLVHEAARRRSRGNRRSLRGRAARAFTGLMLTACICVAAIVWQSSYGDAIRQFSSGGHRSSSRLHRWRCKTRCSRATEPTCGSGSRDGDGTSTTNPSGPDRIDRSRADRRRDVAGFDPVAPVHGARSRKRWGKESSSSRPARNKWPYSLPRLPIRNLRPQIPAPPPRPTAAPTRKPVPTFRSSQATARPLSQPLQIFPVEGN